jgi:hypothetical protein
VSRVLVLVEGQTEEVFAARILKPHLWSLGVHLQPTIVVTRRVRAGANFKGGVGSWGQVTRDLKLLLHDTNVVAVTTLLDYYGLPDDVPGMADRPDAAARDKAEHVEHAMDAAVGDPRLRTNLLLQSLRHCSTPIPMRARRIWATPRWRRS